MNRSSGIGLTVFGIVLVVVGAIMRFAVSAHAAGFNIQTAGVILLLVGIGMVVLSLIILALGGRSRSTTRTDVRETPSGQQRTEQRAEDRMTANKRINLMRRSAQVD
jgi:Na+-transporting methylmalonyl-CoA/oxaloacetate decarboxylase gamma subunit